MKKGKVYITSRTSGYSKQHFRRVLNKTIKEEEIKPSTTAEKEELEESKHSSTAAKEEREDQNQSNEDKSGSSSSSENESIDKYGYFTF